MFKTFLPILILVISFPVFAKKGVVAHVKLSPAGSFEAKAKRVKGLVMKKGDQYTADQLSIQAKRFETGVELRDEHMQEKYLKKKDVIVKNAKGSGGKGTAELELGGVTKPITFSFKEISDKMLEVNFKFSLKNHGIDGIKYMGVGVDDSVSVKAFVKFKSN